MRMACEDRAIADEPELSATRATICKDGLEPQQAFRELLYFDVGFGNSITATAGAGKLIYCDLLSHVSNY